MPNAHTINGIVKFARQLEDDIDLQAIRDGLQMMTLHRKVEHASENHLAGWGLTPRQFEILETLYFSPDGAEIPASLSDEVGLTRSAMTSALDALEAPGYIARGPHPKDRRMITISLAPRGREFIEERLPERYRSMAEIVGGLLPAERQAMVRAYTKILQGLREHLAEDRK